MASHKTRCVVVDDDRDFLEKVQRWFLSSYPQVELVTFTHALDAADYLRGNEVDFVVTAYLMPQIDGLQLISMIRSFNPHVTLYMSSAVPMRDAALGRGANGFCSRAAVWSLFEAAIAHRTGSVQIAA